MKGNSVKKWVISVLLVGWWIAFPAIGYDSSCMDGVTQESIVEHFSYSFCHANVWHLLGNLLVWCMMTGRLWLWQSLLISFLCSWIPPMPGLWELMGNPSPAVTMGFSGVLFAIIGCQWGSWCKREIEGGCQYKLTYGRMARKLMPFVLVGAMMPNVNWSIHLYCVTVGFIYGRHIGR